VSAGNSGRALTGNLTTAGERVALRCDHRRAARALAGAVTGELEAYDASSATLRIVVSEDTQPFSVSGFELVARSVYRRPREAVLRNVCSSGYDLRVEIRDDAPTFTFRRRPSLMVRAAAAADKARAGQLTRLTLLAYPTMWWAAARGRSPLHVAAFQSAEMTVLVGGPSGVGKSTVLGLELVAGARPVSDNICVSDGTKVWPVNEPLRLAGIGGARAPHGRTEQVMKSRVSEVTPDAVVLLTRGKTTVRVVDTLTAARALAAGTYMAGELRRFWSFAATLSAATEVGPAHPPVAAVCESLAMDIPCVEVARAAADAPAVSTLLRKAGLIERGGAA
jgi:hypothetical protein